MAGETRLPDSRGMSVGPDSRHGAFLPVREPLLSSARGGLRDLPCTNRRSPFLEGNLYSAAHALGCEHEIDLATELVRGELAASIRATIESPTVLRTVTSSGFSLPGAASACASATGRASDICVCSAAAQFSDDAVHERVICRPPTATLDGLMIHDTVACKDEAMEKCHRYARLGAQNLAAQRRGGLLPALLHSAWTLWRGFVLKGGCLDGAVGLQVAFVTAKGTWLRYCIAGELMAANRR